jgi:hypothetical protein
MTCQNFSARKQNKKEKSTIKKTLDIQHNDKISDLENIHKEINALTEKVDRLKETIIKFQNDFKVSNDENLMEKILNMTDEKFDLESKIEKLKDNDIVDYFLNTSDILYKYYEMVENGGVSDNAVQVKPIENSILNWFSSSSKEQVDETRIDTNQEEQFNKALIIDKYLQKTDKNYINPCNLKEEICSYCKSSNIVTITSEGYIECNDCHSIEHIIIDHEKPSYKDPPKEISYWAYKRINHFILEWNSDNYSLVICIFIINK